MEKIRVTIWNEFRHEKNNEAIKAIYPEGMHKAIGQGIAADTESMARAVEKALKAAKKAVKADDLKGATLKPADKQTKKSTESKVSE